MVEELADIKLIDTIVRIFVVVEEYRLAESS